ncbi:MAG: ATP-dependent Lhr-like helicase, partial [Cryomorphaceae bacterium]
MGELKVAEDWFEAKGWKPFQFQKDSWRACLNKESGLLNAPTGSGKTYALFAGVVLEYLKAEKEGKLKKKKGLKLIWVTPIRALTKDIKNACQNLCEDLELPWQIAIRTGDTSTADRAKQKRTPPDVLITTPESMHLLMASKGYADYFASLRFVVADEWHELMGSKRAVLLELALSRLKTIANPSIWGISATIGNMEQAMEVLFGTDVGTKNLRFIKSEIKKKIEIFPIIPDEIEKYPWAGHLGVKLAESVLPILEKSRTTLIFTNTRAQAEIWYQHLLNIKPELAGLIAMHHGSISRELRDWVEDALHEGKLKCVVCTSSLDLGVDFRPVETIIQIGSPKGVSRFVQRAGRSGHSPGEKSVIY